MTEVEDGAKRTETGRAMRIFVVRAGVQVVIAFDVVAPASRDCHNTVRELLTGVHCASPPSRASCFTATLMLSHIVSTVGWFANLPLVN